MSKKKASRVSIRPVDRVKKQQSEPEEPGAGQPGCNCGDCGCGGSISRRSEKVGDVKAVKAA